MTSLNENTDPNGLTHKQDDCEKEDFDGPPKPIRDLDDLSATEDFHSSKTSMTSPPLDEPMTVTDSLWTLIHDDMVVFTSDGISHRSKIAGFDMDDTVIGRKYGKTYPVDSSDWKILFPEVFVKLAELYEDGYKIALFSNQLGITREKVRLHDLQTKIEAAMKSLGVPVQVFIATNTGRYRKPTGGMWQALESMYNGGISIDFDNSFFVGDAAGRPANWQPGRKNDFACSDRLFAINVGVKFYTPEEYFLEQTPADFEMPVFDPRLLPTEGDWLPKDAKIESGDKEIIVLVGYPGCGKSHFVKNFLQPKGYVALDDEEGIKSIREILATFSVVVDANNLTKQERARYIENAKQEGVPCRCFQFNISIEHCLHNQRFREMIDRSFVVTNDTLPENFVTSFQKPEESEGFTEIVKVSFAPKFTSSSLEAEYRKFLVEI